MRILYWLIGGLGLVASIYFLFIPAFAGNFVISPVIEIGEYSLRWYGLTMALAIFFAYLVSRHHSWRFGISQKDVDDYTFWVVIAGIIGARAYYVLFNLSYYQTDWRQVYRIWEGGISIYGALIAGLIFTFFYTRKKAYSFSQLLDTVALGLPLGQAIGRLGNFFNHEAFGLPTDLPWKMFVPTGSRPTRYLEHEYFHPAFAYEIVLNLFIFFVLQRCMGKVRSGMLGWLYLAFYSLGRFVIEAVRIDHTVLYGFNVNQVVAAGVFMAAGIMVLRGLQKV